MVLLPDEKHGEVYRDQIADGISAGKLLLFGHGFSVHYGEVEPPADVDVTMIAPKSPGHRVRELYVEGGGTPAIAVTAYASSHDRTAALAAGYHRHIRKPVSVGALISTIAVLAGAPVALNTTELVPHAYSTVIWQQTPLDMRTGVEGEVTALLQAGVDAVFSDNPDLAVEARDAFVD